MRKTLSYVVAIAMRYSALIIQFFVVVLLSRTLSQTDAGIYFILFGMVSTGYCIVGFGLPDGLIKVCGQEIALSRKDRVRGLVSKATRWTLGLGALFLVAAFPAFYSLHVLRDELIPLALWWVCFSMIFFSAQCLVAIGEESVGSFVFYTAANFCLLFTTIPYVLLVHKPKLEAVLAASIGGAFIAGSGAALYLFIRLRHWPKADAPVSISPAMGLGAKIAAARLLQAALYWVPTWAIGAVRGPHDAAIIGAAGRLLIAASAVVAAFRFAVRSQIVIAATQKDWPHIERTARMIATISTAVAVCSLIGVLVLGEPVIKLVLGTKYGAATAVLAVLLIGAVGESFGGPVDEILKLTGHPNFVLVTLVITISIEATLAVFLARFSIMAAAAAQAAAFCIMYALQIAYLKKRRVC